MAKTGTLMSFESLTVVQLERIVSSHESGTDNHHQFPASEVKCSGESKVGWHDLEPFCGSRGNTSYRCMMYCWSEGWTNFQ